MYAFLPACAELHILSVFRHYMIAAKTVAVMEKQKGSFALKIKNAQVCYSFKNCWKGQSVWPKIKDFSLKNFKNIFLFTLGLPLSWPYLPTGGKMSYFLAQKSANS